MNTINNRNKDKKNHKETLLSCFKESDNILIVSPFLSFNFLFFPFSELVHLKEIILITTFKPKNDNLKGKISFFKKMIIFCEEHNIKHKILIDNSLHGKLYICNKNNTYFNAIITSANFTTNGLEINNEWGVSITEKKIIEEIVSQLYSNIIFEPITEQKIISFEKDIIPHIQDIDKNVSDIDLSNFNILKERPITTSIKINYWLKPIGVSTNPISWDKKYNLLIENLHFSKRYPKGVKIGDILIAYAVNYKNILSIYRVKSKPQNTQNSGDRWPNYVEAENLTPHYGNQWQKYNITISNQRMEVISHKLFNITPSGKNSYGSLMRGADKLKITLEFGEYLIKKIIKINNDIATEEE